jgi:hypothetical protein
VSYFAQQYTFRERSWDLTLSDEGLVRRLGRRLFDAGAPPESAQRYLRLSRLASEALAKRFPGREEIAGLRVFTGALRQAMSTPRQSDTIARMEEAIEELGKLAGGK